jgi:hypothetical protein
LKSFKLFTLVLKFSEKLNLTNSQELLSYYEVGVAQSFSSQLDFSEISLAKV